MKAICIGYVDGNYQFKFDGETPEVGHKYQLESLHDGTLQQNKLFHSLVMVYYNSGQHNDDKIDYTTFRDRIKKNLGAGFESFIYVEMKAPDDLKHGVWKPVIKHAKKKEDIPEAIRNDPQMKEMILGKLKPWSSYSKGQRMKTIDNLISEMLQVGINSNKFQKILKGIKYGS